MGKRRVAATGRVVAALAVAVLLPLIGAGPAGADNVQLNWNQPAVTLLLPYFEVDLQAPGGANTIFSINNASASAALAHVVLWSDLAVAVLKFDVYLTGYDVQDIDLRRVIGQGLLPQTASAGQDPNDLISHHGNLSQDINFASCNGTLPLVPLTPVQLQAVQAGLTGGFNSILGGCCGVNHGDLIARGYVTVDSVTSCTLLVPGDPGYFSGVADTRNILYGDYFHINPDAGVIRGASLVHIVAAPGGGVRGNIPTDIATTTPGRYTFYGRYNSWLAIDRRYPLATNWAVRYRNGTGAAAAEDLVPDSGGQWQSPSKSTPGSSAGALGWQPPSKSIPGSGVGTLGQPAPKSRLGSAATGVAGPRASAFFTSGTVLEVWRDPKVAQTAFPCPAILGVQPPWTPLAQESVELFDEQEHPLNPATCAVLPCPPFNPFPLATQRVRLNSPAFPVPFTAGWMYLNLNTTVTGSTAGLGDPAAAQAWVTIVERGSGSGGTFTTGYPATPVDTAQFAEHFIFPP